MSGRGCRTTLCISGTCGQSTYAVRCTASKGRLQCRSRVKTGNPHCENNGSGVHRTADIAAAYKHRAKIRISSDRNCCAITASADRSRPRRRSMARGARRTSGRYRGCAASTRLRGRPAATSRRVPAPSPKSTTRRLARALHLLATSGYTQAPAQRQPGSISDVGNGDSAGSMLRTGAGCAKWHKC
jgi:hypothetical protein